MMVRRRFEPRSDWRQRAAQLGFAYAEIAGEPYWDESAAYEFSASGIDAVEATTSEIERLCRRLARSTFAATFMLAVVAALEMEGVQLVDL